MRPLQLARTAATLVLLSAPVSLAADALAAKGPHVRAAAHAQAPKTQLRVSLSKHHVAVVGIYAVRVVVTTRSRRRKLVHVQVGALSRRTMTGPRGRAWLTMRLAIRRSRTLTIRAGAPGMRPELAVRLRRIGPLKHGPGSTTRANAPPTKGSTGSSGPTGPATRPAPAVAVTPAPVSSAPVTYSHVVLLVEETYPGSAIISGSPYFASLASQGLLFTNYHAVSHPSEPNYMALFSGSTQGTDGSDNCQNLNTPSLAGQLTAAGISTTSYAESGSGYACRHDAYSQFADAQAHTADFSTFPATAAGYASLPSFSVVVPNLTNDMHDSSPLIGGAWAQTRIDGYAQWAKANNSLLIVISDENDSDANYGSNQPGENGNDAFALAVGTGVAPGSSATNFDHYSTLRTIEDIFGLGHLGAAATAADMIAP